MKNFLLISLVAITALLGTFAYRPAALAINCDKPQNAKEQIQCGACDASGATTASNTCNPSSSAGGVGNTITTVVNLLSVVAGVAAVIMIIVGGLRYVTSGGKDESVKSAKNTILYAIIGLVVVALAQIIVHFVINQATSPPSSSASNSSSTPSSKCANGQPVC